MPPILVAVSVAVSSFTSLTNTRAPARANVSAIAAPMPEPAPVTSALFPCRSNIMLAFLVGPGSGYSGLVL